MNSESCADLSKSIFISAGEASGDMHGASLIKELKRQLSGTAIKFSGLGGILMAAEGFSSLYDINDLSTVGFVDVIKKYSFFKKVISDCVKFVRENDPSVVILVDYPGFNIRLAEELKKFYTKKIIYYISPQLWAWHERRVSKIRKFTDRMLVVFPFEVDFYRQHSIEADYVGHPLVKKIGSFLKENEELINRDNNVKVITVLPGSREAEIRHHMPVIIESLNLLRSQFDLKVNISASPGNLEVVNEFKDSLGDCRIITGNAYKQIMGSDLVLTKAGTSTMETAMIGTPHLIFYKTSLFNYYLLKPVVKVSNLGIVNILSGKDIIKEFIQNDFTPENVYRESVKILTNADYCKTMKNDLSKIWDILGNKDASESAAELIIEEAQL